MPIAKVQMPDGRVARFEVPEGTTPEQVQAFAAQQASPQAPAPPALPPNASAGRGGIAGGAAMGLRDPVDAGAQILRRIVPEGVGQAVDRFGNYLADLGLPVARSEGVKGVDAIVDTANAEYDASRKLAGRDGIDVARISGNIANPVNLVGGRALVGANTVRQLAGRGAAVGAGSAALQPVVNAGEDGFAGAKTAQVAAGAAGGAVLTPAAAKVGEGLVKAFNGVTRTGDVNAQAAKVVDDWITSTAKTDSGFDLAQIPASMRQRVQAQVAQALKDGKQIDPAAILRKADFESLGVTPTRGQITRDPTQYARERNLRGVEGAGEPLAQRFQQQNNQLLQVINQRGAEQSLEPDAGGNLLMTALRQADQPVQAAVSRAYGAARDNTGRSANVDVDAFRLAANTQLDEQMLGRFLPAEVRAVMEDVASGKMPLNVKNLVTVDKVLSGAQRANASNPTAQQAIGIVRDALHAAPIESAAGVEAKAAFDTARGLARTRFKVIEDTPGLKAALDNDVPDTFVRKYLIGGDTKSVNNLMRALEGNPEATDQARAQVARYLQSKAFGANAAGDAPFAQASFNQALRALGTNKLTAIFGQEGAEQLQTLGRVGAYINAQPAGSAVNNSNTAGAVMNLLSGLMGRAGALPVVNVARDSWRTFANERFAGNALRGELPDLPAELSREERQRLLRYLAGPAAVTAGALGGALGQ